MNVGVSVEAAGVDELLGERALIKSWGHRASLVVQWLRVHLPVQGTRVRAPVWEDPTCRGAAGPVSHGR